MDFSKLYEFSKSFAPPDWDLRDARIQDDWGDESCAEMPICHKLPDDVTIYELNYYPQGWSFMDVNSILFYAYSVFKNYKKLQGTGHCNVVKSSDGGVSYLKGISLGI